MAGLATYTSALFIFLFAVLLKRLTSRRPNTGLNYPPGPPGWFVVGNLLDIPEKKPWIAYTEWAKQYGDIMHLQAMDDHIVILNSVQAANDLFEKRSRIYSGRPNEEVCETAGWGFNIVIQDHSEKWRQNRRVFQQTFRPDAVIEFRPAIQERVSFFLRCLCESPKDFMRHIDVLSGSISLKLMYGIDVETIDDPLISAGKLAVHTFDTIFAARFVAIMKYVPRQAIMRAPRWFPVLGPARRFIESSRKYVDDLVNLPMQQVQKMNTEAGGHIPRLLRKLDPNDSYELQKLQLMKDMASIAYLASADTMLSSTGSFFLAMANNPRSQKLAQQEIDTVIGKKRLPTLEDRNNLPYVQAIYLETMRLRAPLPLGLWHKATEDDNYNGYHIPQGTVLFANIWAMNHDEKVYPDPYAFKPERFLNTKANVSDILAFGFGRRVCVGRHLADTVLWLTIASVLACFNIEREKDEHGNEIDIPERYSDGPGAFSYPLPFRCVITPRHDGVVSSLIP